MAWERDLLPRLYQSLERLLDGLQAELDRIGVGHVLPAAPAAGDTTALTLLPADTLFASLAAPVQFYVSEQSNLVKDADDEQTALIREATSQYVSRWVLDAHFAANSGLTGFCARCDALLALEEAHVVEAVAPLVTLESALDMLQVEQFALLLDYIDVRRKRLFAGLVPGKGKGLIVLRMANEMRRRLSKPSMPHTLLAGRIATMLSIAFPLGDRSASNLKGEFNLKNTTEWDTSIQLVNTPMSEGTNKRKAPSPGSHDTSERGNGKRSRSGEAHDTPHPTLAQRVVPTPRLYALFWATQQFFVNPALLFEQDRVLAPELLNPSIPDPLEDRPQRDQDKVKEKEGLLDKDKGKDQDKSADSPSSKAISQGLVSTKSSMHQFARALHEILVYFADVNTYEEQLAGTAAQEEKEKNTLLPVGGSVPEGSSVSTESVAAVAQKDVRAEQVPMDVDATGADPPGDEEVDEDTFYPKYLTGQNNFPSEVRDPSFRRQVMIQILILLQYLLEFSPKRRHVWSEASNKLCHRPWVLSEREEVFCRREWKMVLELLSKLYMPLSGPSNALGSIVQAIRRENSWITWKNDRAPPLKPEPMTPEEQASFEAPLSRMQSKRLGHYVFPLGTQALKALWEDGVPRPQPGTTRRENEDGVYVDVPTDGLEELEWAPLGSTDFETYISPWCALEKRLDAHREQLSMSFSGRARREQEWRRRAQLRALQARRTLVISLKSQVHLLEAREQRLKTELAHEEEQSQKQKDQKQKEDTDPQRQELGFNTTEEQVQDQTQPNEEDVQTKDSHPTSSEDKSPIHGTATEPAAQPEKTAKVEDEAQSKHVELDSIVSQISQLKAAIPPSAELSQASATVSQVQGRLRQTISQARTERRDPVVQGIEERQASLAWRGLRLARDVPGSLKVLSLTPFDDLTLVQDALEGKVAWPHGRIDGGRALTPEPEPHPAPEPEPKPKSESVATETAPEKKPDKKEGVPEDEKNTGPPESAPKGPRRDTLRADQSAQDQGLARDTQGSRSTPNADRGEKDRVDATLQSGSGSTDSPLTNPPDESDAELGSPKRKRGFKSSSPGHTQLGLSNSDAKRESPSLGSDAGSDSSLTELEGEDEAP